jgi:biopolymer transport protein ExbD
MAANLGGDDDDGITGINVTPLVDIMLVLLIIFMVASSYIVKEAIEVNLPKAATGEQSVGEALAFKVTADGTLYIGDEPTTREGIAAACQKAKGLPDATALIAADHDVPHGRVTALIDFVRQNGIVNFAINITPVAEAAL